MPFSKRRQLNKFGILWATDELWVFKQFSTIDTEKEEERKVKIMTSNKCNMK